MRIWSAARACANGRLIILWEMLGQKDAPVPRRPRNIVIYSDGTGQRGGLYFDEERTNVYKLYRATRDAPDSPIDPDDRVAFYDPGLGTLPTGDGMLQRPYRK